MSRWYDQHRIHKRLRQAEHVQLVGAVMLERVTAHFIENDKQMRERIEMLERDASITRESTPGFPRRTVHWDDEERDTRGRPVSAEG